MRTSRTAVLGACGLALAVALVLALAWPGGGFSQRRGPGPGRAAAAPDLPGLTPAQLRTAYDLGPLLRRGIDGRGQTIVIVDSFGSPTIARDLEIGRASCRERVCLAV